MILQSNDFKNHSIKQDFCKRQFRLEKYFNSVVVSSAAGEKGEEKTPFGKKKNENKNKNETTKKKPNPIKIRIDKKCATNGKTM